MEEWKAIAGYEGLYEVSNLGRIKSLSRIDSRGYKRNEKILKLNKDSGGYLKVSLYKNGKPKQYNVHRLVAIAFIPNPDNLPEVNHKDENRINNYVDNLEWCNRKYNCNYSNHNEKMSKSRKGKLLGDKNPKSRKVKCITTNEIFNSMTEGGKKYNVSVYSIYGCCKGKSKSAGRHTIKKEKLVWVYDD